LNSKDNFPVQHWAFFSFFEITHCFPPSQWTSPLALSLIWHWTDSHQPTHGSALCNLSRHWSQPQAPNTLQPCIQLPQSRRSHASGHGLHHSGPLGSQGNRRNKQGSSLKLPQAWKQGNISHTILQSMIMHSFLLEITIRGKDMCSWFKPSFATTKHSEQFLTWPSLLNC